MEYFVNISFTPLGQKALYLMLGIGAVFWLLEPSRPGWAFEEKKPKRTKRWQNALIKEKMTVILCKVSLEWMSSWWQKLLYSSSQWVSLSRCEDGQSDLAIHDMKLVDYHMYRIEDVRRLPYVRHNGVQLKQNLTVTNSLCIHNMCVLKSIVVYYHVITALPNSTLSEGTDVRIARRYNWFNFGVPSDI